MRSTISIGIGLFVYNRPSHLKRVLISLENFKLDNIVVFIDGPKNKRDLIIQENIIFMLKTSKIRFEIIRRKKNLGLSKSILSGIDYLSKNYESFIIIEDDCVPYKNFFNFFNYCFNHYKNDENINSICSFQFKEIKDKDNDILKLLKFEHFIPWGWGTWSYKWEKFKKHNLSYSNYPSFMKRFNSKIYRSKKSRDIWSLNYILYQYTESLFSLFPNHSLVKNIGFDGTGVNSKFSSSFISQEAIIKKVNLKNEIFDKKLIIKQKNILKNRIELFF